MQLKEMLTDEDAVSPVIGVILMVAITVILAAVIASFVLGLGPGEAAPTASFDIESTDNPSDGVKITFANGDKLNPDNIVISGDVFAGDGPNDGYQWNDYAANTTHNDGNTDAEIGSGNSITVETTGNGDAEVRVVWETADSSQTLDDAEIDQ